MKPTVVAAEEAVSHINDEDTLVIGGAGAGHAVPDKLLEALGHRYREQKSPKNLKIIHPCGIGDNDKRGLNHLAQKGLVKTDIGGFWGNAPKMIELAKNEDLLGYNFPQGVLSHLMRATAGGEDGILTKTGLHTFVDPRYEGGKINDRTKEDLVELVHLGENEYLYFKTHPVDVTFIRGTSIDKEGNLTMEEEVGAFSMLSLAQAAKSNDGIVIAQVKRQTNNNAAPINVKVPGVIIDYVVIESNQQMTFISDYEPALIKRDAEYEKDRLKLDGIKKIVAQRAAMELRRNDFVNLGYGMPDGVPIVAQNEGVLDQITFMIEQGPTDGVITTGLNFGAMYNPAAIIDDGYQFDFFHGGGLDICFLGFAQVDQQGNVNSSRFGNFLTGCGGFIDISQHTRKVVFCGSFAVKSEIEIKKNKLELINKGTYKKFIKEVEQITFNGKYALENEQEVLYCTERAVFELTRDGLKLIEIAPGVDLQEDLLDLMDFTPQIADDLKVMNSSIFSDETLNMKALVNHG